MKFFLVFLSMLFISNVKAETVYVPGELIDSLIGLTGQYCVPKNSKVGDLLPSLSGHVARIKHLDWLSNGCGDNKDTPVRADVEFIFTKSYVKLNIPENLSTQPVSELDRFKGVIYIGDTGIISGYKVTISSFKRSMILDIQKLLDNLENKEINSLKEVKDKRLDNLTRGNTKIYKREVIGVLKCLLCTDDKVHLIALADDGKDELILLQAEISSAKYDTEKDKLISILTSLDWLEGSSPASVQSQSSKTLDDPNKSQKEKNEENFKKFINGQIELSCEQVKCIGFYQSQLENIKQAYAKAKWVELLVIMQVSNYPLDINYFYLGKAAEELKFRQAAIRYYNNALILNSTTKRCDPKSQCNGIDVQVESQMGIDRLK